MEWDYNNYPILNYDESIQEVFFGNDIIILRLPANDVGDIKKITAAIEGDVGYIFTNEEDGSITIRFLSNHYNKVLVPLNIILQSDEGKTIEITLTIYRVGVSVQTYNQEDSNPAPIRTVFRGTQFGNFVDFEDGNGYKVTASYFIHNLGNERPYGLFVTRKYADGRIETEIITQAMNTPNPVSVDLFDLKKRYLFIKDGPTLLII